MSLRRTVLDILADGYRAYMRVTSPVQFLARRFVADVAGRDRTKRPHCLDAGAGNCPYRQAVTEAFGVREYVALDLVPTDFTTVIGSVEELPFPSERFDLLVSFEAIQHIENAEKALDELARVLRPGGIAIVTFPFLYAECDFHDYKRWTLEGMESEWRRRGFEILMLEARGGRMFAVSCGVTWLLQHLVPGQRKGWRQAKGLGQVLRTAVMLLITAPVMPLSWLTLWLDEIFSSKPGAYMGGSIAVKKPSTH